jgi:small multidrug resistance pump
MLSLFQCWLILMGCIVSEVTGSVCLKLSNGYQHLLPSIFVFVFFSVAFAGFPFALSKIDLGTAYAVWSGIGTSATALIGIFYFHEKATPLKLLGVAIIILGVILLNISEANEESSKVDTDATETSTLVVSMHATNGGSV